MKKNKILVIIVVAIILALGAAVKFVYDATDYQNVLVTNPDNEIKPNPKESEADEKEPVQPIEPEDEDSYIENLNITSSSSVINLLILGIDASQDRTIGIYRSDVIVLARMDLENNNVKVLSIPRDTYAYLPVRNQKDKIGHAYAFGSREGRGPEASAEAIEEFIGDIKVDYYFAIKMDPVPGIVDDIGGVKIDVDANMYDPDNGVEIKKGIQMINGDQALLYLQWRNTPGGDIDRILRVQNFFSSLYGQLRENNQMLEAARIVLKYRDGTETNMTSKHMIALATYFNQLPEGAVSYYTISGRSRMIDGRSLWIPDDNTEIIKEFLSDHVQASSDSGNP